MMFDGDIRVVREAAARWAAREAERKSHSGLRGAAADTPERVQKRLDRLAQSAVRPALAADAAVAAALPAMVETIGFERVLGDPDFRGVSFLEQALAVSRFVGRVTIRREAGRTAGFGTGFMVSPRLLLTNNHVLGSPEAARFSEVEFDFQNDRNQRPLTIVAFSLEPGRFFLTSRELDFTLIAVAERSAVGGALQTYGWSRLIAAEGKALLGEPLNIIQHPRGGLKQIVFRSNLLVDLMPDFAHYTTDTEPGSSGSPVYNDQWEVVALHHSGVPRRTEAGDLIAKDGSIWRDGDDPDDLDWVANEGIRVSSLVRAIEAANLPGAMSPLRRELLDLEPPVPAEAAAPDACPAGPVSVQQPATGAVTLEFPLRITVSLGAPKPMGAPLPVPQLSVSKPALPLSQLPEPHASPGERAAIAELERARERPYFDAAADVAARDGYWDGLRAADLGPAERYDAAPRTSGDDAPHAAALPARRASLSVGRPASGAEAGPQKHLFGEGLRSARIDRNGVRGAARA